MKEKRLTILVCILVGFAFIIQINMTKIAVTPAYYKSAQLQQYRDIAIDDGRGVITDINFDNITNTTPLYKTLVNVYDTDLQQVFNALKDDEKADFYQSMKYRKSFMVNLDSIVKNREIYTTTRRYSDFNIAQHLIGYIDGEGNGVAGLERVFDTQLKDASVVRYLRAETNGYGEIVSLQQYQKNADLNKEPSMLTLTVDNTIQRLCEGIAKEYINNGSIVVMESKTGKIKAMASTPFYSANNVAQALEEKNSPLVNKALQAYEPGSVIKPLWAAALLEAGYNPQKVYNCTGTITVNDHDYHCANNRAHGPVDMQQALVVSCNCYFVNAFISDKGEKFYRLAKQVNLGDGLELTQDYYTKAGYFPTQEELKNSGQLASICFGQGKLLATPVHIAAYMNIFANEGKYVSPQIAQGIYNSVTKEMITNLYNYDEKQAISADTAQKIKQMLKEVVDKGAMERAKPMYLDAAGKTGTAQTGRIGSDGEEILTAWFCGFYPYDNPKYTICITMYDGGESTRTAAPVFKKICDSLFYLI